MSPTSIDVHWTVEGHVVISVLFIVVQDPVTPFSHISLDRKFTTSFQLKFDVETSLYFEPLLHHLLYLQRTN